MAYVPINGSTLITITKETFEGQLFLLVLKAGSSADVFALDYQQW